MDQRVAVGDAVVVADAMGVGVALASAIWVTAAFEALSTEYGAAVSGMAVPVGVLVMLVAVVDKGKCVAGGGPAISAGCPSDLQATSAKRTPKIIRPR